MSDPFERSLAVAQAVRERTDRVPTVALVLGSGLGAFADTLEDAVRIPYDELPDMPVSTVKGHAGRLVLGQRHGLGVVAMQGRVHAYEGLGLDDVVHGLRSMWQLGARTLIVTNAAGALNPGFAPGDLMVIRDHINFTGRNPLVGHNDDRLGPRFPDMSSAYTPELAARAHAVARAQGFALREGVYLGVSGPSYETPAEIRAFHILGGDAVGMSTVPEVIVASHLGMRVLGVSCITNMGAGLSDERLDHADVEKVATRARERFVGLLDGVLAEMANEA